MEKEKKNVSKNVTVCPVCGRFTKKAAVDRHSAALAELHSQIQKEITKRKETESDLIIVNNNLERSVNETTRLQMKISSHDAEVAKLNKIIDDQAKHITDLTNEVEAWKAKAQQQEEMIDKLQSATWWQRLFGIQP